jgi:hypothetical protein
MLKQQGNVPRISRVTSQRDGGLIEGGQARKIEFGFDKSPPKRSRCIERPSVYRSGFFMISYMRGNYVQRATWASQDLQRG